MQSPTELVIVATLPGSAEILFIKITILKNIFIFLLNCDKNNFLNVWFGDLKISQVDNDTFRWTC